MNTSAHIVFYDDGCPLCDAEIEHYKKIKAIHPIEWLGIHSSWEKIQGYGFTKETLLKRIHAVNSQGVVVCGAAAFVLIWSSLKYYSVIAHIVTFLRLVPVLDFFYKYFAAWRYKKNKHCNIKE